MAPGKVALCSMMRMRPGLSHCSCLLPIKSDVQWSGPDSWCAEPPSGTGAQRHRGAALRIHERQAGRLLTMSSCMVLSCKHFPKQRKWLQGQSVRWWMCAHNSCVQAARSYLWSTACEVSTLHNNRLSESAVVMSQRQGGTRSRGPGNLDQ